MDKIHHLISIVRRIGGGKKRVTGNRETFELLNDMLQYNREPLPWIVPLADGSGSYLLLAFKSTAFRKYGGKEIGIFGAARRCYSRLPGALPDGQGHVEAGIYKVKVKNDWNGKYLYLDISKDEHESLKCERMRADAPRDATYTTLEIRHYDYDEELHCNILAWLEWYGERIRNNGRGAGRLRDDARFRNILSRSGNLTGELEKKAATIERLLHDNQAGPCTNATQG